MVAAEGTLTDSFATECENPGGSGSFLASEESTAPDRSMRSR